MEHADGNWNGRGDGIVERIITAQEQEECRNVKGNRQTQMP